MCVVEAWESCSTFMEWTGQSSGCICMQWGFTQRHSCSLQIHCLLSSVQKDVLFRSLFEQTQTGLSNLEKMNFMDKGLVIRNVLVPALSHSKAEHLGTKLWLAIAKGSSLREGCNLHAEQRWWRPAGHSCLHKEKQMKAWWDFPDWVQVLKEEADPVAAFPQPASSPS